MDDSIDCEYCFNPFPRYATICPACKAPRWELWFQFIPPDPETGEYNDRAEQGIHAEGLKVVRYSEHLHPDIKKLFHEKSNDPYINDLCLLLTDWPNKFEKPLGDVLVKQVGYFWEHATRELEPSFPVGEFPPLKARSERHLESDHAEPVRADGTWMTASEAQRWAADEGMDVSLSTMNNAKKGVYSKETGRGR
jgi:hypothetical protein